MIVLRCLLGFRLRIRLVVVVVVVVVVVGERRSRELLGPLSIKKKDLAVAQVQSKSLGLNSPKEEKEI